MRRDDQRARLVRREDDRRVPVEPELALRVGFDVFVGRPDALRLAGDRVLPRHIPVLRFGVDNPPVARIHQRHEAVAALHLEPVVVGDAAREACRARSAPVVVVLHAAAHVERRRHVVAHVVEEPDGQIGQVDPRLALVVRHGQAAVVADQHMVGVLRIDPDRVMVRMDDRRGLRVHRLAAVGRHLQIDPAKYHDVRVVGIDPHLAEVHRTRVGAVHTPPARAAVFGSIETGGAATTAASATTATTALRSRVAASSRTGSSATTGRRRTSGRCRAATAGWGSGRPLFGAASPATATFGFDQRVKNVGAPLVDVEPDPSERAGRDAVCQPRPGVAVIGRLPNPAPGPAAVHTALRAPPLIRRGVHGSAIGVGHHQVVRARIVINLERLLPGLAGVGRLEDAALAARSEQRAGRRDEHDVVVLRIDDDAIDVVGLAETHVRPRLAAVRGLVDTVAPRRRLPVVRLAAAGPDQVGILLRDRDVANRNQPHVLELRLERRAVIDRLPDAAVSGADVVDRRIRFVHSQVRNAAGHRRGSNGPEVQSLELLGDRNRRLRLADERSGQGQAHQNRTQRDETQMPQHGSSRGLRGLYRA